VFPVAGLLMRLTGQRTPDLGPQLLATTAELAWASSAFHLFLQYEAAAAKQA